LHHHLMSRTFPGLLAYEPAPSMPGNDHNRIDKTRKAMRTANHDDRLVLLQHDDGTPTGES